MASSEYPQLQIFRRKTYSQVIAWGAGVMTGVALIGLIPPPTSVRILFAVLAAYCELLTYRGAGLLQDLTGPSVTAEAHPAWT